MIIYLLIIIYHLFIAALHCQPPVWTIWSELQRQVWLWGEYREYYEYSPLLKRRVRWSLSLSHSVWERIACSLFGIGWKLLEDTEFCFRCERVQSTAWTCRLGIKLESWCQQYFSYFLNCGYSFIQTSGLFGEPMLRIMGILLILGIEAF